MSCTPLTEAAPPAMDGVTPQMVSAYLAGRYPACPADTFILFGGIGDQVLWLSLLGEHRKRLGRPVTVVTSPSAAEVPAMFAGRSFDHLRVDGGYIDKAACETRSCVLAPNERIAWHCYYGDDSFQDYTQLCATAGLTNLDLIRRLLSLPEDAAAIAPLPRPEAILRAAGRFRDLGLPPGRTVLIAPLAKSYPTPLDIDWWVQAVAMLRVAGYAVINNVGNTGRGFDNGADGITADNIPGVLPVDVPLAEIIPFTEICGNFLGLRSGLCDLLARANATKIVVYPEPDEPGPSRDWTRGIARFWSLNREFRCEMLWETLIPASGAFDRDVLAPFLRG